MKQILGVCLLFPFFFSVVGQEIYDGYRNGLQITGTKVERNFEGDMIWEDKDSSTYVYDEQQRLILKEDLYFNDTIWVTSSRVLLEYDSDNQSYVQTSQCWNWEGELKEEKHQVLEERNEQDQLATRLINVWKNETLVKVSRTNYQYDEWGNTINTELFRFVNEEWKL